MTLSALQTSTWKLIGQGTDAQPRSEHVVDRSPFLVGRRPDMSLTLASATVSGRHAELLLQNNQLYVRDLGSTNGTFVNGVRVADSCVVNHGDLIQFANVVFRTTCGGAVQEYATIENDSSDRALALIQFDKLMTEKAVVPHYQPLISMDNLGVIGYEVLGRSRLFGLSDPHTMFDTAAVLNLESELSRLFRQEGIREGQAFPGELALFMNTHPVEVNELDILELSLRELRDQAGTRPLVLEIHEATATRSSQMALLRNMLRDLDIGLAYDDFGAGQARLVELVEVPPDYLKFDIELVRGIGSATTERQKMVESLVKMTLELGIVALAEGVEAQEDHDFCKQIGFTVGQGYLYGRPVPRHEAIEKLSNA